MANSLSIFATVKAAAVSSEKALQNVPVSRGWWPLIQEPFTGAWQRNKEERIDTLLQYPTLYACVSRIATDIGKMPFSLKAKNSN